MINWRDCSEREVVGENSGSESRIKTQETALKHQQLPKSGPTNNVLEELSRLGNSHERK